MMKCPYPNCDFEEETQEAVDEHVVYMIRVGDKEHEGFPDETGDIERDNTRMMAFGKPDITEQIILGFNMGSTDDMLPHIFVRDEGDRPDSTKVKKLDRTAGVRYELWFDNELLDWVVRRV